MPGPKLSSKLLGLDVKWEAHACPKWNTTPTFLLYLFSSRWVLFFAAMRTGYFCFSVSARARTSKLSIAQQREFLCSKWFVLENEACWIVRAHAFNPSTQARKAGGSWVQKQPELHNKPQASLSYRLRSELKKVKGQNNSNTNNFFLSIPIIIAVAKIHTGSF